jgi:hypothetical protein
MIINSIYELQYWCGRKKYILGTYLHVYCNLFIKGSKSNATKQIEGTYFHLKKENGISFTCLANNFEREFERSPIFNTFKHNSKGIINTMVIWPKIKYMRRKNYQFNKNLKMWQTFIPIACSSRRERNRVFRLFICEVKQNKI